MIDFDTFTKIAKECRRIGQINCCQRLQKLAQSPKIAQSGHTAWDGKMTSCLASATKSNLFRTQLSFNFISYLTVN